MKLVYQDPKLNAKFIVTSYQCVPLLVHLQQHDLYKIIWSTRADETLTIDGYKLTLQKDQVLFCTPVNAIVVPPETTGLITFSFNPEFYCIDHNDHEVSCMGLLFYGSARLPVINLTQNYRRSFEAMMVLFIEEFEHQDTIQGEMLRTLLKRIIIIAVRLYKNHDTHQQQSINQVDLIRRFNLLVEQHYRQKHQVADYAAMLYKSPKTLSNLFRIHQVKSPLSIINDRLIAEAKKLLVYSNLTAEEITYELGYREPSHFSKFFKKHEGLSPVAYRKQHVK